MVSTMISDLSTLQTLINNSKNGDTIIIQDNSYKSNATYIISGNGLTIRSETPGGVIFVGGSVMFSLRGANNVLSGFQFVYGSSSSIRPGDLIQFRGSNNLVTNMNFDGFYVQHTVNFYPTGQYNTLSYCNFQAKPIDSVTNGSQVEVQADPNLSGYHNINHCSFQKMLGSGLDGGNEPIRLGEGSMSTFNLRTIVEYCVFDNTQLADSETISVKSQQNIIRYNTFTNQQKGFVSFRNGNYNIVYGNYFINASGIRIKQATNVYAFNNYFENCNTPFIFEGVSQYSPSNIYQLNINFQNNTYYNCGSLAFGVATSPDITNTFANNIIYNSSPTQALITGDTSNTSFINNMYCGNLGITSSGFINLDPLLEKNINGYYSISSSSPAIGGSNQLNVPPIMTIPNMNYDSTISLDISVVSRSQQKAIGCNEYFTYVSNRNCPLSVSAVGPSYLS